MLPHTKNPPAVQPPEVLRSPTALFSRTQRCKADVYCYAIILWQIFTRKKPYAAIKDDALMGRVLGGLRPDVPPSMPPVVRALLPLCWSSEASRRPTFDKIAQKLSAALAGTE